MPPTTITSYQDALDYLYSFVDFERKPARTPQEAQHNLDRTRALLDAVGTPPHFKSVVIAGTKGKGSTAAILESILRVAGYRTGLWTSPHLNSYRERMQVNRVLITQAQLVRAVQQLQPIVAAFDHATYGTPTVFELSYALTLSFFAEQQIDVAVLEVGLGGRYDATNAITPLVSAVSSISYDHMHVLGDTLSQIAYDKAGIFKPGVPAVTIPQHPEAAAMLARVAHEVGTPLHLAAPAGWHDPQGLPVLVCPTMPAPRLRGAFQLENAQLACGIVALLRQQGLPIPDDAISQGLATVQWAGRLEVAGTAPLLVLDGAHNGDSAQKLIAALQAEFSYARLILVLGMSRDKHTDAILEALLAHTDTLVLTHSRHPRAYTDLDKIAAQARPLFHGTILFAGDVPDALDEARRIAHPNDLICVTGSLFVVGAAREALGLAVSD
ncbi:MAG: bifunctional folylpolyglutamate synthase/dihydrofolate synthase [Chloroflexaceae bacterium]|nr:bifunctional folylpolyglutamate synthase/dihydrofolate synthase [Chloroflexaceae bacterium]NJO05455.1 bifunctional folylpolyglutamate synthase/dihydrofolate synthase [Chloroflexaceae bacterium]